eukprot:COSAG06_NODE_4001_length_4671_cov_9.733815_2_plen_388_part_00
MRASPEHRVARRSSLCFAACPVLAVALLLLLPNGPVVPAAARRSKAATKKAATSVRRTPAMRAAGEAGQRLIDTMTGRGSKGGSAEQLLDAAVAAYTDAAEDPANNQTEAWYQIGYLQKGFYQEEQKRLGEGAPALRRHRTGAFAAYQHLVTEINPGCLQGWEGLASVHDDMATAGEAQWEDVVQTYRDVMAQHPSWVRGARRAAEIVLTEHGVADTEGGRWSDTDALELMDSFIDLAAREPGYFRRHDKRVGPTRTMQFQHFNQQWIFRAASSMHAERGELGRALMIEGLSCSMESCPDGASPLNAAAILPHYNVPLPPLGPEGEDEEAEAAAAGASEQQGEGDVFVYEQAVSEEVFKAVAHGFRLTSSYWGRGGEGYAGDFYSHW